MIIDESIFLAGNEHQFWNQLDKTLADADYHDLEAIDDVLRTWLAMVAGLHRKSPERDEDIATCTHKLLTSPLFIGCRGNDDGYDDRLGDAARRAYIRTQMIYSLLEEDDLARLHAIACFLLLDGRGTDEATFPRMVGASCFPRLIELIGGGSSSNRDGNIYREHDPGLHRLLLQLMYEMAGMERLGVEDLLQVEDGFIQNLFAIIEGVSDDVDDPYHYPTIRVLLVLNEQYMLASTATSTSSPSSSMLPLTNRVVKCISLHGPSYRTFGENIILLLNRETETSLQLLILKLLYLLFTTKSTYEYFYTNDLKVLLDVIIRNLMDLPDEKVSLRHTYLRVLYPLLAHTQLSHPPHYKRDEIVRVLGILRGSGSAHFAPTDDTTLRLVDRVSGVAWLLVEQYDNGGLGDDGILNMNQFEQPGNLQNATTNATIPTHGVVIDSRPYGTQTPGLLTLGHGADTKEHAEAIATTTVEKIPPAVPLPRRHRTAATASVPSETLRMDVQTKVPPKAPPPRRWGRLKAANSHASDDGEEEAP